MSFREMSFKESLKKASEYLNSKKLFANQFNGKTTIYHSDGSKFIFSHSLYEETKDFVYLWSEYNGYHFWVSSEIEEIEYEAHYPSPKENLYFTTKDFIETNKLSCEKDIDKLCPPSGKESNMFEYSVNEFLKECCKIIGFYKEREEK